MIATRRLHSRCTVALSTVTYRGAGVIQSWGEGGGGGGSGLGVAQNSGDTRPGLIIPAAALSLDCPSKLIAHSWRHLVDIVLNVPCQPCLIEHRITPPPLPPPPPPPTLYLASLTNSWKQEDEIWADLWNTLRYTGAGGGSHTDYLKSGRGGGVGVNIL